MKIELAEVHVHTFSLSHLLTKPFKNVYFNTTYDFLNLMSAVM